MHHIILFDTDIRESLLPFTFTRPVCNIRLGILTITEKWQQLLPEVKVSYIAPEHLEPIYPIDINDDNYLINGALLPTHTILKQILNLETGDTMMLGDELIATRLSKTKFERLLVRHDLDRLNGIQIDHSEVQLVEKLIDLTQISVDQISVDMELLGVGKKAGAYNNGHITGEHLVHIDPSANIENAFINATDGPVYIGANALVMDGAKIRGPVAIGNGSIVKSHAFLSKGVSIGPQCEIGGEIKHSVFLGYSNKSHEGYVGDSVIGEWCNLGALTSNSNLRNSFTDVQLWDYTELRPRPTGRRKCGFFMGDYSRTAIQTQINSGTIIGVSCHVFGQGMAKVLVPSFTWGGINDSSLYDIDKAIDAATVFHSFKDKPLSNATKTLLRNLYQAAAQDQQSLI